MTVDRLSYYLDPLTSLLAGLVSPALIGLILLAAALRYKSFIRRTTAGPVSRINPRLFLSPAPLLTLAERKLMRLLNIAMSGRYAVCPQVAFSAFITHDPILPYSDIWRVRAEFNRCRADFVIYDWVNDRVVCLVELDDASHKGREDNDARRDLMALKVGIKTIRLRAGKDTTPEAIAEIFSGLYASKQ
jgi:hypothetical protein